MDRKSIILGIIAGLVIGLAIGLGLLSVEHDKVTYYERVIEDFGIDEFVHFPELYNTEGYVEQVQAHICMPYIEPQIENYNKLLEEHNALFNSYIDLGNKCGANE